MIVDKIIEIKICSKNLNHFKNIGYIVNVGDTVKIPVEHLSYGSGIKIGVKCDICGTYRCVRYQDHFKILEKNDGKYKCQSCNLKIISNEICGDLKNISCVESIKEKKIKTNLMKYGVDNPSKVDDFKKKKIETNLKNNGCEYSQQNSIIFQKTLLSGKRIRNYDGKIYFQGSYEKDFLDLCKDLNIIDGISKPKSISYYYNNKLSYYHPDFYIEKLNLILEIKSTYWFNKHKEKNELKFKSTVEQGYNFILILNKNYDEFVQLIR